MMMYEYFSYIKIYIFELKKKKSNLKQYVENGPSFVENNILPVQLQESYLSSLISFLLNRKEIIIAHTS